MGKKGFLSAICRLFLHVLEPTLIIMLNYYVFIFELGEGSLGYRTLRPPGPRVERLTDWIYPKVHQVKL